MSTLSQGERMEIVQRIPMSWEEYLQRPPEERSEWADGPLDLGEILDT